MMDSAQIPVENVSSPSPVLDNELETKVKKASEKIAENLHIFANDPSLACYRLQEHIQKSLPQLIQQKIEVKQVQGDLRGKCYDLEMSINYLSKSMEGSQNSFQATQALLQSATKTRMQMSNSESKSEQRKKTPVSMYQRFSGSFDLPSSFLPSGLSSSSSVSADLKSTAAVREKQIIPGGGGRRARASSVSSTPPNTSVTKSETNPRQSSP